MSESPRKPQRQRRTPRKRQAIERPEPYDPLKLENLGRSIEAQMLLMDPVPIIDVPQMYGAGIYAIYYVGDHETYQPISDGCQTPIYVGKAVHKGGRKGLAGDPTDQKPLWNRIQQHRASLEQAKDLAPKDFRVRYLVAVDVFVALAEQLMIRQFQPVWNTVVDGFGNHSPGGKRLTQARPPWDELHPGRPWSAPEKMPTASNQSAEQSRTLIQEHWKRLSEETGAVRDPEESPLPFPEVPHG